MTVIHSLVIKDLSSGFTFSCTEHEYSSPDPTIITTGADDWDIEDGLRMLVDADVIIGHNIQDFDIPAIQKLHPWFKPKGLVRDTLIMSRLMYADMFDADYRRQESQQAKGKNWIEKKLFGRHSLESWGQRLGHWKGDYGEIRKKAGQELGLKGDALSKYVWGEWSPEMQSYCEQDVEVNTHIWNKLISKGFSEESIQLEHDVRRIITRQEKYGFAFDEDGANELFGTLNQKVFDLEKSLKETFKPWFRSKGKMVPGADRKVKRPDLGINVVEKRFSPATGKELRPYEGPIREQYFEGAPYTKIALEPFNPGSRNDISNRLIKLYGWKPKEFTADGNPKVDEEILSGLKYECIPLLNEYLMIKKRIGQVSEGKEAWLKQCRNGRLHGSVNTNGAVTGRMTHSRPNMAQVPSGRAPYGHECRALFIAGKGKKLVGCDADALELRDLAGYMAKYDDGAYIRTVLEGKKEDGTDMHTLNAKALGCDRDTAKTWFYAFIYGAGDFKLGLTLGVKGSKQQITQAGALSRKKFLKSLPALAKLTLAVKTKANSQGWIKGLDGRILTVRSGHAALNTLLQSAGAIQMKRALVILDNDLQELGLIPGIHYEFVANVHDEWQIEVDEDKAELVGRTAAQAIRKAGEYYNFRCHLAGNFDIGNNWNETH